MIMKKLKDEDDSAPLSEHELRSKVNKTIEKKQVTLVQQAATKKLPLKTNVDKLEGSHHYLPKKPLQ